MIHWIKNNIRMLWKKHLHLLTGKENLFVHLSKKQIVTGDKEDTLLKIEHGKIKPSKQLQDALVNMLKGNQEFVMLDEQKVVYESILDYSCQCQKDGKKRTIIVEGGPGTGKQSLQLIYWPNSRIACNLFNMFQKMLHRELFIN